ncbi:MAG TPA: substrate-binding domain-containing protein [Xanthobacteraceae bacterium]|nr:substrate-binding domain-containing protein [Xanthobacteraceae bacterium]
MQLLCAGAMHGVIDALATTFEGIVGKAVDASFTNSGGVKARVMAGERADVAISTAAAIDELARHGKISAVTALARSPIGIAVRAGASRPDIGTVDSFERALVAAKSIAIADPATGSPSGNYLVALFERLALTASLRDKIRYVGGGAGGVVVVGEAVARGDAEMAIQQIPELVGVAGLDVVGELPAELQQVTVFSAAVVATTSDEAAARRLVACLASSQAEAAIRAKGMQPVRGN